jgi:hypothetical protein
MKRLILMMVVAMALGLWPARAADSVEPASCTFTNARSDAVATVAAGTIYRNASLNLTNCVAQTTNSVVQGLSGVTVSVSVGNTSTNIDYTATVQTAASGTWHCTVTVPDLSTFNVQVKLTDSLTNSYIYANKVLSADQSQF